MKDTFFAAPERASTAQVKSEIEFVSSNPVVEGLLHSISGLIAILDDHRQIVAVNNSFLDTFGIKDAQEVLGLRHGEAIKCIHAEDEPAGCGTTKYCSSCGAAIAIVSSLADNKPVSRLCALTSERDGSSRDMALRVQANPIMLGAYRYILLFLQDVSEQERRAALERTFFHDVKNMLHTLTGGAELLNKESPSELSRMVHTSALRLIKEVEMQRVLSADADGSYRPCLVDSSAGAVLSDLENIFAFHPVAVGRNLRISQENADMPIHTDTSLVERIVCNMITNALEAEPQQGVVRVWADRDIDAPRFNVWNAQAIPEETALRVFQRNFSTKPGMGRGVGAYSMKLFGEEILGGKVRFTSSPEDGTTFMFSLPVK